MEDLANYLPDGAINPRVREVYRGLDIISYQSNTQREYVEGFAVNLPEKGKDRVFILGQEGTEEGKSKKLSTARAMIDDHFDVKPQILARIQKAFGNN